MMLIHKLDGLKKRMMNQNNDLIDNEILNLKSLDSYFEDLQRNFSLASTKLGGDFIFDFKLANKKITISSAGERLLHLTTQALAHLEIDKIESNENPFVIYTWDEKETSVPLPEYPWITPEGLVEDSFIQFHLDYYFVSQFDNQTILYLYNFKKNVAFCIVKDADKLTNSFLSSPFFKLIALWASKQSFNILHAGCVSLNNKGVLIVGRSGKGKSSTSVQCAIDGLDYLSDDYILIDDTGEKTIAYSILNSGKLKLNHIERFNKIKPSIRIGNLDQNNKPLFFLSTIFKDQVKRSTEIKAIIVPEITSNLSANYYRISSVEALKALAPSTLVQLRINGLNELKSLADLTRKFPNYCLEIGSDFEDISTKVKKIINEI
jgi:hypothetical protein